MDGEADALALDDARIEDSVHCEGCGATFDVAEIVESPYEADDGGAYCAECAAKEWARTVEENSRLRAALDAAALERLRERYDPGPDPACWRCGGPMQPTGYSPGRRIYRWYCYRDGAVEERDAGEPDVLALLAAYDAAAARADALAEQLERLRSVLVLHASPDLLAALHRAALAPGEGGPDGGR